MQTTCRCCGQAVEVPDPPELRCSQCGRIDEETYELEWSGLIDIRVMTAEGEEGYDDLTQLLCAECWGPVLAAIQGAGFRHHRHGGIRFLEDVDCPGGGNVVGGVCPNPREGDPYDGTLVLGQ